MRVSMPEARFCVRRRMSNLVLAVLGCTGHSAAGDEPYERPDPLGTVERCAPTFTKSPPDVPVYAHADGQWIELVTSGSVRLMGLCWDGGIAGGEVRLHVEIVTMPELPGLGLHYGVARYRIASIVDLVRMHVPRPPERVEVRVVGPELRFPLMIAGG